MAFVTQLLQDCGLMTIVVCHLDLFARKLWEQHQEHLLPLQHFQEAAQQ